MLKFLEMYWPYIWLVVQAVIVFSLSIILLVKNRHIKLIDIVERAIEEAEKLGGTAEQKKTYAVAIIKSEIKVSYSKISDLVERFIAFSKNVNSQRNKTIQEVLSDEFKERN